MDRQHYLAFESAAKQWLRALAAASIKNEKRLDKRVPHEICKFDARIPSALNAAAKRRIATYRIGAAERVDAYGWPSPRRRFLNG